MTENEIGSSGTGEGRVFQREKRVSFPEGGGRAVRNRDGWERKKKQTELGEVFLGKKKSGEWVLGTIGGSEGLHF